MKRILNEFPKKSNSKRMRIFRDRAEKKAEEVLRKFLDSQEVNYSDSEIKSFSEIYAKNLGLSIRENSDYIFSSEPPEGISDEELVDQLVSTIKDSKLE